MDGPNINFMNFASSGVETDDFKEEDSPVFQSNFKANIFQFLGKLLRIGFRKMVLTSLN